MSSDRSATLVRFADLSPVPWRNGGGITREVAVQEDEDGFAWRISIADVAQGGAFSTFPGVDRTLVLCRGAGMVVDVAGRPHRLGPFDSVGFSGDADTSATLPNGPTVDLNVMTRRSSTSAQVSVEEVDGALTTQAGDCETAACVVLDGSFALSGGQSAYPLDTVLVTGPGEVALTGRGRVARITLTGS